MGAWAQAIFSRSFVVFIYLVVTVIESIGLAIKGSLGIAVAALVGWAFCFFASATFVGSFLARQEKKLRITDLFGIGAIAAALIAGGFWLVTWSGAEITYATTSMVAFGRWWALRSPSSSRRRRTHSKKRKAECGISLATRLPMCPKAQPASTTI